MFLWRSRYNRILVTSNCPTREGQQQKRRRTRKWSVRFPYQSHSHLRRIMREQSIRMAAPHGNVLATDAVLTPQQQKRFDLWVSPQPTMLNPRNHPCWHHRNQKLWFPSLTPNPPCWPHSTIRAAIRAAVSAAIRADPLKMPCWPNSKKTCWFLSLTPTHGADPTQPPVAPPQEQKNIICESHPNPPCLTRLNHPAAIRVDPLNIPCWRHRKKTCWFLSLTLTHRAWPHLTTLGGPTWTKKFRFLSLTLTPVFEPTQPPVVGAAHMNKNMWFVSLTSTHRAWPHSTTRAAVSAAIRADPLNMPCWPLRTEKMLISESHPHPRCWPHSITRGDPTEAKHCDLWVSP